MYMFFTPFAARMEGIIEKTDTKIKKI